MAIISVEEGFYNVFDYVHRNGRICMCNVVTLKCNTRMRPCTVDIKYSVVFLIP